VKVHVLGLNAVNCRLGLGKNLKGFERSCERGLRKYALSGCSSGISTGIGGTGGTGGCITGGTLKHLPNIVPVTMGRIVLIRNYHLCCGNASLLDSRARNHHARNQCGGYALHVLQRSEPQSLAGLKKSAEQLIA
jgi:hypothetical protein